MKVREAIDRFDNLVSNSMEPAVKVGWLSRLDTMVKTSVFDMHQGGTPDFHGYDDNSDFETEMLIPEPYTESYLRWMETHYFYTIGEIDRYNNAASLFNEEFSAFKKDYHRKHLPLYHGKIHV